MTYYSKDQSSNPLLFLTGLVLGAFIGPMVKKKLDNSEKWQNMKDKTVDKYQQTREAGQNIYNQMVDEVTDKYARAKGISSNELADLVDDLKMHWGRIKQAWNE
ncbi:MAG: hypothetical protein KW804_01045 [Candidatus Doudnabacteria bacterium]|nr:hypothetical protein [Candidatus Doudnabacteria bacterium]